MNDTASIGARRTSRPLSLVGRLRFRLRAEREIDELTRDHDREEYIRAEAAVRLAPGPWHLGGLFRRHR